LYTSDFSAASAAPLGLLGAAQTGIADLNTRLQLEKGESANYPHHNLTFNFLIDLPFGRGRSIGGNTHGVAGKLLEGWQIASISTFQSGLFFSPRRFGFVRVADGNLSTDQRTISRWFDTDAFLRSDDSRVPNSHPIDQFDPRIPGRDILEGPGLANIDFSVFKNVSITEHAKVRFTADFFNLFNHPNFGNPNNVTGIITSLRTDPRIIQFSLRVEF